MADKPVFIADGHHRYETGLRYLEEARAAGLVPNDEAAGQLHHDDARVDGRPRPRHPADAPAHQRLPGPDRRPTEVGAGAALHARTRWHPAREAWENDRAGRLAGAARLPHQGRQRLADGAVHQPRR